MKANGIGYSNNIQTTQNPIGFKGLIKVNLSKLSEGKTTNIIQDVYELIGQGLKKDELGQDVFIGLNDKEPVSLHGKRLMIATTENDSLSEGGRTNIQKYLDNLKTILVKHLEESEIQNRVSINKTGNGNKAGISDIHKDTVTIIENFDEGTGNLYSFYKNGKYNSDSAWTGISSSNDYE